MKFKRESFYINVADGVEKRDGYVFSSTLEREGDCILFGVYKTEIGMWNVIDLSTGLAMATAATRKEAAEKMLDEQMLSAYWEMLGMSAYIEKVVAFCEKTADAEAAAAVEETAADNALDVTIETMRAWCAEHPNTCATLADGEGACIKIHGDTKPYKEELKELGFRWSRPKRFWWK